MESSKEDIARAHRELSEYLNSVVKDQVATRFPMALVALVAVTGENYSVVSTESEDPETVAAMMRQGAKMVSACREVLMRKGKESRCGKH